MTGPERSAAQIRYEAAQEAYHLACGEFEQAIRLYIAERVRNYYPQATGIALAGRWNNDDNFNLRVTAIKVGSVLLNMDDEPDDAATNFASVAAEIAGDLDWLTDLTGGFYQTSGDMDFDISVTKEKR